MKKYLIAILGFVFIQSFSFAQSKLFVAAQKIDKGIVDSNALLTYEFEITAGEKSIMIDSVFSTCGGVSIKSFPKVLKANTKGIIQATIQMDDKVSSFIKSLQVYTSSIAIEKDVALDKVTNHLKQPFFFLLMSGTSNKVQMEYYRQSSDNTTGIDAKTFIKTFHHVMPIMVFDSLQIDAGNLPEGPAYLYSFRFKNESKFPLSVRQCQSSCGCVIATWPKEPIAPGHEGVIEVNYNTQGRPGHCSKTVTVILEDGFILERSSKNLPTDINPKRANRCVLAIKCNVMPAAKEDVSTPKNSIEQKR
jgi:Protein of unknown function (DUF1573)